MPRGVVVRKSGIITGDPIPSLARRWYTQRRTSQPVAPGVSLLGSPAVVFSPNGRFNALKLAAVSLLLGAGRSHRPFPRPQRLPLSRIPFRGQRPWPAASLPRQLASRARSA
jgi:hypothetical protein